MPIELGIWKLGEKLQRVTFSTIDSESKLEQVLCEDLSLLSPQLMLIGRQVPTDFGKFIDILAMDVDGNLTVVELKRDKTPREVVAQSLDYASWVQNLSYEQIAQLYADRNNGKAFEEGFADVFGTGPPEKLNESHNLVVVASELDASTERIINYLADNYGVPINAVFFRYFREGDGEYITRTWLIDPQEAEVKSAKSAAKKDREPWNGRDFYVRFAEEPEDQGLCRSWDDARKYGFVSGDGASWISRTLSCLFPGARIFVNVAQRGYVGVGTVTETVRPIAEFKVAVDGGEISILDAPLKAPEIGKDANAPAKCELVVRVDWFKTVPKEQGYWEKGLFATGHT
ncbi:MAG: DUF91 domain-containing protein, partial [Planctomycetaceae bacterium]